MAVTLQELQKKRQAMLQRISQYTLIVLIVTAVGAGLYTQWVSGCVLAFCWLYWFYKVQLVEKAGIDGLVFGALGPQSASWYPSRI